MTPDEFRKLALSFGGAIESAHMGHPDFRVAGRIFASLGPAHQNWGMVKLTAEQQQSLVAADASSFQPCSGAWGRRGCTSVLLASARKSLVKAALEMAFGNAAAAGPTRRAVKPSREGKSKRGAQHVRESVADRVRRRVIRLVESLPEATAAPCEGGHLSLEVRGKRFGYFLVNHHGDGRLALNLKAALGVSRKLAAESSDRFHIPKYVERHGWVGLWLDVPRIDWPEVARVIQDAYRLTAPKSLAREVE